MFVAGLLDRRRRAAVKRGGQDTAASQPAAGFHERGARGAPRTPGGRDTPHRLLACYISRGNSDWPHRLEVRTRLLRSRRLASMSGGHAAPPEPPEAATLRTACS